MYLQSSNLQIIVKIDVITVKKQVMAKVIEAAQSHDFKITLDGKNADDEKFIALE